MEPKLILKERILTGLNLINQYYDNFIMNSLIIFFILMIILILGIKIMNNKTKKQKLENLKDFYNTVMNFSN